MVLRVLLTFISLLVFSFVCCADAVQRAEVGGHFFDVCDDASQMYSWSNIIVPTARLGENTARLVSDGIRTEIIYRFDRAAGDSMPLEARWEVCQYLRVYDAGQEELRFDYSYDGVNWYDLGVAENLYVTETLTFSGIIFDAEQSSLYLRMGSETSAEGSTTLSYIFDVMVSFEMGDVPNCSKAGSAHHVTDITGPWGFADCYVDLYDFAAFAADWLRCTAPGDISCTLE